eukprot:CAMPEP_0182429852 /NCGR_PEP_ID=MMETSP1167-20130531/34355_1 /TAXON_ID=2988 /ORGANISM="Mallomonas Sp, Strain CCMP3275" /LENGTH=262 /DNA_ID=CAMNT_0024614173 /DNA_START=387 /DNA_END=1175 /DNA_ORIENTATION=-
MSMKWGENMSQEDFLNQDNCILVNEEDSITGQCSKREAHMFTAQNPRGLLHRAFSVFLFDLQGRLLLQRRALHKPTFPGVWTNTCCSHPLGGFTPSEVDGPEEVRDASVPGIRAAAIRKLHHELGVPPGSLSPSDFRLLTRILYCSPDQTVPGQDTNREKEGVTHSEGWCWGEHELDYILFVQANVTCHPNPEEVCDMRYVTPTQLQEMLNPPPETSEEEVCQWSPWFRILAKTFLSDWWKELDRTINTDEFVDWSTIHNFY